MSDYRLIGKDFVPPDITGKVTGKAKYAEDFRVDGMVFALMYTSPMAHGKVTRIDTSKAEAMDGVVGILTADDVPEVEAPNAAILTNSPAYIGDPILAVAAETEQIAEDAMAAIEIDIEPLPFATDPLDSLLEGGPNAREEGNVFARSREGSGFRTVKWSQAQVDEFRAGKEPTGEFASEWGYGELEQGFADAQYNLGVLLTHDRLRTHEHGAADSDGLLGKRQVLCARFGTKPELLDARPCPSARGRSQRRLPD